MLPVRGSFSFWLEVNNIPGKGQEISTIASGGKSQAGLNGHPSTTHGGGTADDASDGASDHGRSTADSHRQGHDTAGSGNTSDRVPAH